MKVRIKISPCPFCGGERSKADCGNTIYGQNSL